MDGKLDAKRLEELAAWAETEANALDYEGSVKASGRLRDLARCARAWAKVEKELLRVDVLEGEAICFWRDSSHSLHYQDCPTAIEAVEAAEVGK